MLSIAFQLPHVTISPSELQETHSTVLDAKDVISHKKFQMLSRPDV